jgi:hypothetical protein
MKALNCCVIFLSLSCLIYLIYIQTYNLNNIIQSEKLDKRNVYLPKCENNKWKNIEKRSADMKSWAIVCLMRTIDNSSIYFNNRLKYITNTN